MAIDANTEALLGQQMEAFRAKFPTAFIGYEFGNGTTKIRIFKDTAQKELLVKNTFNGEGDDAVRMHVRSCLVELGIPYLSSSLMNDVTQEMCASLVRQAVADDLKAAREKHDKIVEESSKFVTDTVAQVSALIKGEVFPAVQAEIARYDAPRGFWQCFFDRFRKTPIAAAIPAQAAGDKLRLTYDEWNQVHDAEREVDTRYLPRAIELDEPQTLAVGQG